MSTVHARGSFELARAIPGTDWRWTLAALWAFDRLATYFEEEMIMQERATVMMQLDDETMGQAIQWAGAFVAGFTSPQTRRAYRRDLDCWFAFCAAHQLHPFRGVRRTHLEVYLRELEVQDPPPAPGTLYRWVATLSSWFRWLEDEDVTVGNPAARIRRPQRHTRPQPWLNRNELTDLLAAAEDEGGDPYALACLLGFERSAPRRATPTSPT